MNRTIYTTLTVLSLALAGCGDDGANNNTEAGTTGAVASTGPSTTMPSTTEVATNTSATSSTATTLEPGGDSTSTGGLKGGPRGKRPTLAGQIDRAGRVAISTATIETFQTDEQIVGVQKDAYNAAGPEDWSGFVPQMMTSLGILDSLDATCGNQLLADAGDNRYEFLATILADDRLWVNSESGTCGVYLGVEAEAIGAVPAGMGGCGGRTPADDVIERSYSILAAGTLAGIDDGVPADDGNVTEAFPFLGAPE